MFKVKSSHTVLNMHVLSRLSDEFTNMHTHRFILRLFFLYLRGLWGGYRCVHALMHTGRKTERGRGDGWLKTEHDGLYKKMDAPGMPSSNPTLTEHFNNTPSRHLGYFLRASVQNTLSTQGKQKWNQRSHFGCSFFYVTVHIYWCVHCCAPS